MIILMYGRKGLRQASGNEIVHSSLKVGKRFCIAKMRSPRVPMVPAYLQYVLAQRIAMLFLGVHSNFSMHIRCLSNTFYGHSLIFLGELEVCQVFIVNIVVLKFRPGSA